jgi:uncharacterized membrane protein YeaQ/YmgE (transglycosylase-associated protein family)
LPELFRARRSNEAALEGASATRIRSRRPVNTVVGILGGLLGGWFATEELHWSSTSGFLGALLVAFLGAVALRLILNAMEGDSRSRPGGRN